MKKLSRKIRKLVKQQAKDISYQEAWNKVAEFMNNRKEISFSVNPWPIGNGSDENKYTLSVLANDQWEHLFIADKEWNK